MERHGYRALLASGASYWRDVRHGRPLLQVPFGAFVREVAVALRPQYFAFSALAALAGAAAVPTLHRSWSRVVLAACVAGLGWGVGQLVNDLLDVEADTINAPGRAIAAGRLPVGPALAAAATLGAAVAIATALVHPQAWVLAGAGVVLLVGYNAAKRLPAAGNVAHGALMAVAAAIGVSSAAERGATVGEVGALVAQASPVLMLVAVIAAWYLQGNYEKDRAGDRLAGYITSATVMSVRASALLRAGGIVAIGTTSAALALLPDLSSRLSMAAAVVCGVLSTVPSIRENDDVAALGGYRRSVTATVLGLLALAAPLLGARAAVAVCVAALGLVHWAFSRDPNP